jgi:hypothetical protein
MKMVAFLEKGIPMRTKAGAFPIGPSRLLTSIIVVVTSLCFLTACDTIYRLITHGETGGFWVNMSATGKFESMAAYNTSCTYTANEITLRWKTQPNSGKSTFIGGEGKQFIECDGTFQNLILDFDHGTIDGENYSGTVHVTGPANAGGGVIEDLDFPASWTAHRKGDNIEGVIDGLGGFSLKVNPAPEDWQENE